MNRHPKGCRFFYKKKKKETPKGLSFWYNLSMQTLKFNHKNYSRFSTVRQLVLPLDYSQMMLAAGRTTTQRAAKNDQFWAN